MVGAKRTFLSVTPLNDFRAWQICYFCPVWQKLFCLSLDFFDGVWSDQFGWSNTFYLNTHASIMLVYINLALTFLHQRNMYKGECSNWKYLIITSTLARLSLVHTAPPETEQEPQSITTLTYIYITGAKSLFQFSFTCLCLSCCLFVGNMCSSFAKVCR